MVRTVAAALFLALASFTGSARADERDDAIDAEMICLADAARQVDDGASDAATIASALSLACPSEHARLVEVYSRGQNARVREMLEERFETHRQEMAVNAVLLSRKWAREAAAKGR